MRMARPTSPFALTPADLVVLQGWLRMSTLEQSLALRARILLLLADGLTPKVISEQLQVRRRQCSSGENAIWRRASRA